MKKLIIVSLICAAGILACGRKIVPESGAANSRSGNEKEKTASSGSSDPDQNNSSSATPSFNNMAKSTPQPMEGPRSGSMENGKTVYVTKCGACHGLKSPGDYTSDQMTEILKTEIPKANLSGKEAKDVTAYLLANTKK